MSILVYAVLAVLITAVVHMEKVSESDAVTSHIHIHNGPLVCCTETRHPVLWSRVDRTEGIMFFEVS